MLVMKRQEIQRHHEHWTMNQKIDDTKAVELTLAREVHGFQRTRCGCDFCTAPCKHVPGGLDPADLAQLCPEGQDIFAWAEQHLRALTNKPYPTLVPARAHNGHCHWFFDGQCAVHENSPYGCAFFDAHMSTDEVERRRAATIEARREDAKNMGLYYRVWLHLCGKGLTGIPGDRKSLNEELRRIYRHAERRWRQVEPR